MSPCMSQTPLPFNKLASRKKLKKNNEIILINHHKLKFFIINLCKNDYLMKNKCFKY